MQTQLTEPTVLDPEAVAAFFARHPGSEGLARSTVRIVQEEFADVESLTLQTERDPEEDAEWVCVTVAARLDAAALRAAYYRSVERCLTVAPSELWPFVRLQRRGA